MHNGILYLAGQSLKEMLLPIIGSELIVNLIMTLVCIVIIFMLVAVAALVFTLGERKLCAWIQVRIGPNRVGPWGILQSTADMLKLLTKEDIIPRGIDRWLWVLSPILIFIPAAMVYALYPFDDGVIFADVNIGLFLLIAISSQSVLPFLMGGYASNSKYAMLGGMRTVAQMLSYEVPMVIALMGIVMLTGSLKMSAIVEAQSQVWFIFLQPIAFVIFMTTCLVESNRPPFNMVEGESEIIAGPFTEYTGMRWALFFLAEFANRHAVGTVLPGRVCQLAFHRYFNSYLVPGWLAGAGLPAYPAVVLAQGLSYGLGLPVDWLDLPTNQNGHDPELWLEGAAAIGLAKSAFDRFWHLHL